MPSAISLTSSIIPDFREFRSKTPSFSSLKSPKSAKRFFNFPSSSSSSSSPSNTHSNESAPPVPPLPGHNTASSISSTTSLATSSTSTATAGGAGGAGFRGATVVRTPQEALQGIKSLTPPILPLLPIATAHTSTSSMSLSSSGSDSRRNPTHTHLHSNSLDKRNGIQPNTAVPIIHRSASATEELRSPIFNSYTTTSNSGPPTPATAPCRSGIVGVKGVLKSPSYGYLREGDSNANQWAREVLGSIRISSSDDTINHSNSCSTTNSTTESKLGMDLGEGEELSSYYQSFNGHEDNQEEDDDHRRQPSDNKPYQPSFMSISTIGYSEDQYKPYQHHTTSTSTFGHIDNVRPVDAVSRSNSKSNGNPIINPEKEKERSQLPIRKSSTLQKVDQAANTPIPNPIRRPCLTPTFPQGNAVQGTYKPLDSKPNQKCIEEEEDRSFLLALPTRDFTRSPSYHSMNPPSPLSSTSKYSFSHNHHSRSPSTPSTPSPNPIPSHLQTHVRSPSSPAEFSPSPLSPSPNAPIRKMIERPSLLSHRSTVRPLPPAARITPTQSQSQNQNQTPFHATLLEDNLKTLPAGQEDLTLVILEFAYSLDGNPNNEKIILPLDVLKQAGSNNLSEWIEDYLSKETNSMKKASTIGTIPEMTDGESAEDSDLESDNGLNALLRDEYLNSFLMPDPPSTATSISEINETSLHTPISPEKFKNSLSRFPVPPPDLALPPTPTSTPTAISTLNPKSSEEDSTEVPVPIAAPIIVSEYGEVVSRTSKKREWKRSLTHNQHNKIQSVYPTPLSSLATTSQEEEENRPSSGDHFSWIPPKTPPLQIRRHTRLPPLPGRSEVVLGTLRELRVFLTREAGSWHRIAHRMISGQWGEVKDTLRTRVIDELNWNGMSIYKGELEDCSLRSRSDSRTSENGRTINFPPVNTAISNLLSPRRGGGRGGGSITPSPLTSLISSNSTTTSNFHSTSDSKSDSNSTVNLNMNVNGSSSNGFIGFTPLSENQGGKLKRIGSSSSLNSMSTFRSGKGSRVSGVSRGGLGYI
ncbi:uncharacterized protein IL334_006124 [Kwoniella shivajii]|uniref:Uncharacterized protein n=1 Tax=Kwoniella shivajii TaxID=564305 RepID=A0ABZ1D6Y6_9TREE|nr:hypothetical protein IL334_006124 [Kwoniella shivajii]